jgi:PleD family two-component response regulator
VPPKAGNRILPGGGGQYRCHGLIGLADPPVDTHARSAAAAVCSPGGGGLRSGCAAAKKNDYGRKYMYKILVVDDEDKIRELIKKYASFEGYEVEEASGGLEAISLIRNRDFDLVILDIMMSECLNYV